MIQKKQQSRIQQIDSFIDDLAARYGGSSKPKASKRKAAAKTETATKNKRRK